MSKSFHGPFRVTRTDVKFGDDGDCFLTLHDGGQTTIGVILPSDHVVEIAHCLEAAASRLRDRALGPAFAQINLENDPT